MRKKIFIFIFFFSFLIWDPSSVSGHGHDRKGSDEDGRAATSWIFSKDAEDKGADSKGYEELQNQLKALMDELKRLEEDAEDKIRKEMIPFIKREIERLREWLKKLRPKKDQEEPVMTRIENKHVPGTPPPGHASIS